MKTSVVVWIIIIVIAVIGGWYLLSARPAVAPAGSNVQQTDTNTAPTPTGETQTINNANGPDYTPPSDTTASSSDSTAMASDTVSLPMSVTVKLTSSGFVPSSVTIAKGGTVTWVDESGQQMWVASGVHPTHTAYDDTSKNEHCTPGYAGPTPFDECTAATDNYSFTFDQVGTWGYHNHVSASETGTVIVE